MSFDRFKSSRGRAAVLVLAIGAALHFAVSGLVWGATLILFCRDPNPPWRLFLFDGGPAGLLLLWFVAVAVLAGRRRRVSAVLLAVGLFAASALFVRDAATRNWQMHAESYVSGSDQKTFFYFTWWWYDQRWLERATRWWTSTARSTNGR